MNNPFTVEEINLICIYSNSNKQDAMAGISQALSKEQDEDMARLMHQTIEKLDRVTNEQFSSYDFVGVYE